EAVCTNDFAETTIVLTGSNLSAITSVTLNGTSLPFNIVNNTTLEVQPVAGITSGVLELTNAYTTGYSSEALTVYVSPVVAPITNGHVAICMDGSVDLNSTSPGGQWSPSDADIDTVNGNGLVTQVSPGQDT